MSAEHEHVETEENATFPPDYKNYLVYVDESGIQGGSPFYGWGSLWIPAERRGDLARILDTLKRKYKFQGEVKWKKMKGEGREGFACALIDAMLQRNWMMFHCILVPTASIRTQLFRGGMMEARLHHLSHLLRAKIRFFNEGGSMRKTYHVRVDPLPSSYMREHEKLAKINNAMLRAALGEAAINTMAVVNSKGRAGIQLADLLLGAVLCPWQENVESDGVKARISKHIYSRLGWTDHRAGTFAGEWKFNLWWLSAKDEKRHAPGRACKHYFPVHPYRRAIIKSTMENRLLTTLPAKSNIAH